MIFEFTVSIILLLILLYCKLESVYARQEMEMLKFRFGLLQNYVDTIRQKQNGTPERPITTKPGSPNE